MSRRQCGLVVRATDLKFGGRGFKSRSGRQLVLFLDSPEFSSSVANVNSQLGFLTMLFHQFKLFLCEV